MKLVDFDYQLPKELIAQTPLPRSHSKLLKIGEILEDLKIPDIIKYFEEGDVLVLNNTRVIPSLLRARKSNPQHFDANRIIHFHLHKSVQKNIWLAFAKPRKKVNVGDTFVVNEHLTFHILEKSLDSPEISIEFDCPADDLLSRLKLYGDIPLPPYIKRNIPIQSDVDDYQTVFASIDGAVAAPTAGLHFTTDILRAIQTKGAHIVYITLHVGGGTFLPIRHEDITEHSMHAEAFAVPVNSATIINNAKTQGKRVIAVGTTVLRALESVANEYGVVQPGTGETKLFIWPGYRFKVVDMLLTNFHLPKSTLFILACAFAGTEQMKRAYFHAIQERYRFFSYGDACLLTRATK